MREGIVGNGIDTFGAGAGDVGITIVNVIVPRTAEILHFVGAGIIGVVLDRAAAHEIENVAVGIVVDRITNADTPSGIEVVFGNRKLAEVIVSVLHRIIGRLACPIVSEAGGFNAAIKVTGAAPAGNVGDVFRKAVAINSQQPAGRIIKMIARFCAVREGFGIMLAIT